MINQSSFMVSVVGKILCRVGMHKIIAQNVGVAYFCERCGHCEHSSELADWAKRERWRIENDNRELADALARYTQSSQVRLRALADAERNLKTPLTIDDLRAETIQALAQLAGGGDVK